MFDVRVYCSATQRGVTQALARCDSHHEMTRDVGPMSMVRMLKEERNGDNAEHHHFPTTARVSKAAQRPATFFSRTRHAGGAALLDSSV